MKLKIGHLSYEVRRPTITERVEAKGALGTCFQDEGVIWIAPDVPVQAQAAILVHEAIHAIYTAYNLRPRMDEETTCRSLEGPLVSFLADNPSAVAAIIAASQGVPLPID